MKNNKSLSYTRAREIVLETLGKIGLEKSKFGLHSLRSGGASQAANAGVQDCFILSVMVDGDPKKRKIVRKERAAVFGFPAALTALTAL